MYVLLSGRWYTSGAMEGPWTWVVYEITEAAQARELRDRGVGMIETMAFAELVAELAAGEGS